MTTSKVTLAAFLHELASRHTKADIERSKQRDHRFQKIFPIVTAFLILGIVVLAILDKMPDILNHYQHRDWSGLVNDSSSFLFVVIVIPLLLYRSLKKEEKPSLAEKLVGFRERLSDEQSLLPIEEEPNTLEAANFPFAPTRIGPIRRWKSNMVAAVIAILFFLLIDVFLVLMLIAIFSAGQLFAVIVIASLLVLPITAIIGVMPLLAWGSFFSRFVHIDTWGLRWKPPAFALRKRGRVALAWKDINGFYVIRGQGDPGKWAKAYVLDSPKGMFYWPIFERSSPQERQTSAYLTRLIFARTLLPLRDLTNIVEPLLEDHQDSPKVEEMVSRITMKGFSRRQGLL